MQLRNSPMAKSPPTNLPVIPGVTSPPTLGSVTGKENKPNKPFANSNRIATTTTESGAAKNAGELINHH